MRYGRILIYSHNTAMLDLIRSRLESPGNIPVTAASMTEAKTLLESDTFDIFILAGHQDLDNVLDLMTLSGRLQQRPSCVVVEINADRRTLLSTLNAGCSYFVDSTGEIERIEEIVSFLMEEKREITRRNGRLEIERMVSSIGPADTDSTLSRRENEILHTMLRGMGNREISRELGISEKTVKNHLWKIYRKFNVENRTQLFNQLLQSCPCMRLTPRPASPVHEAEPETTAV